MIKAAVLPGPHSNLVVTDVELAPTGPGDVVIEVGASGICHSDLLAIEGRLEPPSWPAVLGHEAAGTVAAIGDQVSGLNVGDRVVASFVAACGRCFWCTRDQAFLCESHANLTTTPKPKLHWRGRDVYATGVLGSFAEAMIVPADAAIRVDSDLPDTILALVGCALGTGVSAVTNAADVRPGESVLIVGVGGVGQAVIQAARIVGAHPIIAVDPDETKRDAAKKAGATSVIDPTTTDVISATHAETAGRGTDFAFESAGLEATALQCYQATRRGGTVVFLGAQPPRAKATWGSLDQMTSGRRTIGALYGCTQPRRDFPRLVRMIEVGLIDAESLVTATYHLDDINSGIRALTSGTVTRGVVEFR